MPMLYRLELHGEADCVMLSRKVSLYVVDARAGIIHGAKRGETGWTRISPFLGGQSHQDVDGHKVKGNYYYT